MATSPLPLTALTLFLRSQYHANPPSIESTTIGITAATARSALLMPEEGLAVAVAVAEVFEEEVMGDR